MQAEEKYIHEYSTTFFDFETAWAHVCIVSSARAEEIETYMEKSAFF
jgi:hypothetical protein